MSTQANYQSEPKWEKQANGRHYNPKKPFHVRFRWIEDRQSDGQKDKQRTRTCATFEAARTFCINRLDKVKYFHIYDMRRPFGQDLVAKWTPANDWNHFTNHINS